MSRWPVCGHIKCLATADAVKVIHPGLEEHHLFTFICHTDFSLGHITHISTHILNYRLYLLLRLQHHILHRDNMRPDNPQLHCLSEVWVTGSNDKRNHSSPLR